MRQKAPKRYGRFVHTRACAVVKTNFGAVSLFVVFNAIGQAAIAWAWDLPAASTIGFIVPTALSALWLLLNAAPIARLALADKGERIAPAQAARDVSRCLPLLAAYMIVVALLVWVGFVLAFWPGIVIGFLFVFTPFAVLAGDTKNPLGASVKVLGGRVGRSIVTLIVQLIMLAVCGLLMGLTNIFLPIPLGTFVNQVFLGFMASWWLAAWGVIYRSAAASSGDDDPAFGAYTPAHQG